uniref:Uncharacterized protein n=1 Tax=Sphaerodactylus townsendi TaxID=933632 RepID=A0ACB8FZW4_9SAUR
MPKSPFPGAAPAEPQKRGGGAFSLGVPEGEQLKPPGRPWQRHLPAWHLLASPVSLAFVAASLRAPQPASGPLRFRALHAWQGGCISPCPANRVWGMTCPTDPQISHLGIFHQDSHPYPHLSRAVAALLCGENLCAQAFPLVIPGY